MIPIRELSWDSDFFGFPICAVTLKAGLSETELQGLEKAFRNAGAHLAYVFLEEHDLVIHENLIRAGAKLYDEKITYSKNIPDTVTPPSGEVRIYTGDRKDQLLFLALLAGHESRFKKDPRLTDRFAPLYNLWLENSLNGSFADRLFVYGSDENILGFITCKVTKEGNGSIGLIATAEGHQGKGIGKDLILASDAFFRSRGVSFSTVVTQGTNEQACRFYERTGFTTYKKELVYHWWFK
ncbi:MAG TPA: GNAT family N-acetyltransferase [Puia sp.]|jgi:dTDP-4-amino-4,6-dideoxy-D-galactose acyltransferase|nr:GNAT family N-acetyltransferase [Puia sp.]